MDAGTGTVVIVAYRPRPGKDAELLKLTREHVQILRELGFATEMQPIAMAAQDGTIVEVFEWAPGAIEKAHHHPSIQAMWERYATVCDYVPLKDLPEAAELFAGFKRVDLSVSPGS
jgi:hypothetical protein